MCQDVDVVLIWATATFADRWEQVLNMLVAHRFEA